MVDRDRLPKWAWLLLGLFGAAFIVNILNVLIFFRWLPEQYGVIPVIGSMVPVFIYVGLWHDDDRSHYWEFPRLRIVGDLVFVVFGAIAGAGMALAALSELGLTGLGAELVGVLVGFITGWLLFYFRNPELYRDDDGR